MKRWFFSLPSMKPRGAPMARRGAVLPVLLPMLLFLLTAKPAVADVTGETAFVLNSFLLLFSGALVMLMAAGFAMLEAGLVRSASVTSILTKNIAIYAIACLGYYLLGYNLMYVDVTGWVGSVGVWQPNDSAAFSGQYSAGGYASHADLFFQMAFVATAASVVSGTLAERIKLWPFLAFTTLLTSVFYPIAGSWKWGKGWLDGLGFLDFAGSTLVHSVGGWAALAGALVLGARHGRFGPRAKPMPGSNLPLAALGTFILWFGWFGFNGGSQLALGSGENAIAIATIIANTNIAACAGAVTLLLLTQWRYGKVDLTMVLNGALAGLVSITAEPVTPSLWQAALIGAAGGGIVLLLVAALNRLRIDDVVGAIPVHLGCGIFGTLMVPWTNADASFSHQLCGVLAYAAFIFPISLLLWLAMKYSIGIRVSAEDEKLGSDIAELGMEAYPEFIRSKTF